MGCSMNLLTFGYSAFVGTKLWEKRQVLKSMCSEISDTRPPSLEEIAEFAFDKLFDSIRITMCFENFMKSLLLLNGYFIHDLSKDYFPELARAQKNRPIRTDELITESLWILNEQIKAKEDGMKYQISGITNKTVTITQLLKPEYQKVFLINKSIINICKPFFSYRNNIHLNCEILFDVNKDYYTNLILLASFINDHVLRIHNQLIDILNLGADRKIKLLEIDNE